jgi:hypothetical protein
MQPQPVIPGGAPGAVNLANDLVRNKILGTENSMLQNQFQGNMALGNIYQKSLNPDGTVNTANLNRGIAAAGPAVGYVAPEAYGKSAGLQGTNLANQGAAVGQSQSRLNDFYTSLGPLEEAGTPPTRSQVISTAIDLVHQGRLLPQDLPAIVSEVPLNNGAIPDYVQRKFGSTLSPSQQATPTTIGVTPSGQPIQGTQGQFLRRATPSSATAAGSPTASGSPSSSPGITTTLPLGQPQSIQQNVHAFNTDQQGSASTLGNVRRLDEALPLISELSASDFGPGSGELAKLKGLFTTFGVIPADSTSLPTRQDANKYLHQYAEGAIHAGRSDAALAAALAANPNLDLTQPANLTLIKNQVALDRQDAAIPLAFSREHPNAADQAQYLKFKSQFYQNTDRRAFGYDMMTPQERRQVIDSLGEKGSPAYQKFIQSYQLAKETGILQPAQAQQ